MMGYTQCLSFPRDRSRIAVGVFLKAAYEVLHITRKPLTAPEIVEAARARGLLKTSGMTPEQTMKSKLATNILTNGDRSPFMRAAKGRFALREWKGAYPEHIADRYQKALFDEDIVVFPATSLRRYVPVDGLYRGDFDKGELYDECRPMRRREAEEDFSVIQLISVFVIRHNDLYLTYKRTKRLPESRLHGVYSLGFGGHLNPNDLSLLNIFDADVGLPFFLEPGLCTQSTSERCPARLMPLVIEQVGLVSLFHSLSPESVSTHLPPRRSYSLHLALAIHA